MRDRELLARTLRSMRDEGGDIATNQRRGYSYPWAPGCAPLNGPAVRDLIADAWLRFAPNDDLRIDAWPRFADDNTS